MTKSKHLILVVDDEPISHIAIEEFLSDGNYELLFANSGEEGLAMLNDRGNEVELVLLDRLMPGIDGIEVMQIMKSDPILAMIPVVMLTAAGKSNEVAEGIKAGCFYYLSKPFDPSVLGEVVSVALKHYESQKSLSDSLKSFNETVENERQEAHQATMMATYHYLNNALNQFQLVLMQLEMHGHVEKEIVQELKDSIQKTAYEMREFGQLKSPTRENVQKFINERL